MMVADASAILAIALGEHDAPVFELALATSGGGLISAVNFWEVLVRVRSVYGDAGGVRALALLRSAEIEVRAVDAELAMAAADAFQRFKGRPGGRLNMGDCFAYALAAREADGLLFKGDDFPKTDVKNALTGS